MNGYKNDPRSLFIILCAAQYSTMLKGLALFAALLAVSAAARLQAYVPEMEGEGYLNNELETDIGTTEREDDLDDIVHEMVADYLRAKEAAEKVGKTRTGGPQTRKRNNSNSVLHKE